MTNTGKVLIIGLLVIDVGVAGYLLFPKEERAPAATGHVIASASTAAAGDSRASETQVAAGTVVRATPGASGTEKLAAVTPVAPAPTATTAAAVAAAAIAPAVTVTPAAPSVTTKPVTPAATAKPAAPVVAAPRAAPNTTPTTRQAANGSRPATRAAVASTGVQQSANGRSKPALHADQARGRKPDDPRRRGSNQVSAALTAQLVKESAKPDPSLPLPPGSSSGSGSNRHSSNPVASAMTDQLVRESSRVNLSSPSQSYKH
jgi:hypothetical protein